jgi:hypothetical protein
MKLKFINILNESYANELGDPLDGRKNACFSSLYEAQQLLVDALRLIENAYQECDDEKLREEIVEFKKDLMHDFGHNDSEGFGHDEENENENNLINRIGDFIDKHTPKNWDANIHKEINPEEDVF